MKKGFSLIEILVVIGILGVILAFGMTINLSAFTSGTLQGEESKIVSVLSRARSHAMANMFQTTFGVCYDSTNKNYVIFQGITCNAGATTSELIPANKDIATDSASNILTAFPIVFEQLTGKPTPTMISVADAPCLVNEKKVAVAFQGKTSNICINNEGTINW